MTETGGDRRGWVRDDGHLDGHGADLRGRATAGFLHAYALAFGFAAQPVELFARGLLLAQRAVADGGSGSRLVLRGGLHRSGVRVGEEARPVQTAQAA